MSRRRVCSSCDSASIHSHYAVVVFTAAGIPGTATTLLSLLLLNLLFHIGFALTVLETAIRGCFCNGRGRTKRDSVAVAIAA